VPPARRRRRRRGRGTFERAARAAARLASRYGGRAAAYPAEHPRRALLGALVGIVLLVLALPRDDAPAPVFAGFRHVVDELGLRLVEGHADALHAAARESGVSATLLAAIVYAESRGRGGQTSRTGALGLGQLAPAAASDAAKRLGLPPPGPEAVRDDDTLNLRLSAAHLAWLLANSQGWSLEQVLVSYNAGRTRLFQWIERAGSFEAWVAEEERRAARGQSTTGSLAYARQIVAIRERLSGRGKIRDLPGRSAP
jgi:soluble lytic murein transglycosylase-like protein